MYRSSTIVARTLVTFLAFFLLRAAPAAAATPYDWPEMLRTTGHASDAPSQVLRASKASSLGINWMSPLHYADLGSPVAAYNATLKKTVAYVGDENGDVIAFDEATGKTIWSTTVGFGDSERATPMVAPDGSVWVGTAYNPTLWKLDGATGAHECSMQSVLSIDASPQFATPPGGVPMVFVSSIDSNTIAGPVYGVRQSDCAVLWKFTKYLQISGPWDSAAYAVDATHKGRVYVGTADPDDTEYAIDANTGALVWTYTPSTPPGNYDLAAGPTVSPPGKNGFADGVLYFPTKYGVLYAVDLTTGAFIWEYDFNKALGLTGGGRSSAALDGSTLVYGMVDGVEAVDAKSGNLLWHYVDPANLEVLSSPAIVGPPGDKIVVLGDTAGIFHALRLSDGTDLYDFKALDYFSSSPAVVKDHVLIDSADGFLYDFAIGGGKSGSPSTVIVSPANGKSVPNPSGGTLKVEGSAADAAGLATVSVSVQAGGPNGPWWDAATKSWASGPVDNFVPVARPKAMQSDWHFAFPVPSSGSTYRLIANAYDVNRFADRVGATSSFTVLPNKHAPQLTLSAPRVPPAGSIKANATGFAANENVVFTLQGDTVAQATTDSAGAVTGVPIHVAATDAFGPSALTATGQTSNRTTSATLDVTNLWKQAGYSATQTNYEPNDPTFMKTLQPTNGGYLARAWIYETGAPIDASPAVVAGTAYVANDAGTMTAVDAATGAPLWTYATPTNAAIHASPAAIGDKLVFGADDGTLYDLVAATGKLAASAALDGTPTPPSVAGSTVYVGTDGGTVYAFDAPRGTILWSATVPAAVHVAPAVDAVNGLVFAGDDDGNVTVLNAATGAPAGAVTTGGAAVTVAPALYNGVLFVAAADGMLRTFTEATGAPRWTYAAPAAIHGLAIADQVYVGSDDGTVAYVDQATGKAKITVRWGHALVGLSTAKNVVFGESVTGAIAARKNLLLGGPDWTYQTGGGLTTTPALVDGAMFAGAEDGGLYAFTNYGQPPEEAHEHPAFARIGGAATALPSALAPGREAMRLPARAFEPFGPRNFPLHVDRPGTFAASAIRYHGGPLQHAPRRYAIVWGFDARTRAAGAAALATLRARGPLAGSFVDGAPLPRYVDDASVQREIARAIDRNGWSAGGGAQFVLLTAANPAWDACAYHSAFDLHGTLDEPVVYGVVQLAQTAPCGGLRAVLAREEAETASDPLLNAWHDDAGNERDR